MPYEMCEGKAMRHHKNADEISGVLIPLEVPWEISPSVSFLRLYASECPMDKPTLAKFIANFYLEAPLVSRLLPSDSIPEIVTASTVKNSAGCGEFQVAFDRGIWCRITPSHSDSQVVNEAAYDWSRVPGRWDGNQDVDEWKNNFHLLWQRSGLCPDPRCYKVDNSIWLRETGAGEDRLVKWNHYLLMGHDACVEVIAKGWSWERI